MLGIVKILVHVTWLIDFSSLAQPSGNTTVGKVLLEERGLFNEEYWYWICIGALLGFSLLFNGLFIAALTYLSRK